MGPSASRAASHPRTQTSEELLIVAERLFAERGIAAVSLRQIVAAAGHRNPAAIQYHFGDKEGLIRAIVQYRVPVSNQRRLEMLAALEDSGETGDLRRLLAAAAVPLLELHAVTPYYVRFLVRLFERGHFDTSIFISLDRSGNQKFGELLNAALADLPPAIISTRRERATTLMINDIAAHQKAAEEGPVGPDDLYIEDLLDTLVAVLSAPPSLATLRALARASNSDRLRQQRKTSHRRRDNRPR
jgi:AcrR family transcriptional regulator